MMNEWGVFLDEFDDGHADRALATFATAEDAELAVASGRWADDVVVVCEIQVVVVPETGREVRKHKGKWEAQPPNDNYWKAFDDLLDAVRFATPKGW